MANRGSLHKLKFEEFKKWLKTCGIKTRPGKGWYQVLQIKTKTGWKVIYKKDIMPEHYVLSEEIVPIFNAFLNANKQ